MIVTNLTLLITFFQHSARMKLAASLAKYSSLSIYIGIQREMMRIRMMVMIVMMIKMIMMIVMMIKMIMMIEPQY